MATCPDVLLGRKQQVWVALEDTPGMIAFPSAQDIINPTSDVAMNQETPVTDSREKAATLDVLNVFQGIASLSLLSGKSLRQPPENLKKLFWTATQP